MVHRRSHQICQCGHPEDQSGFCIPLGWSSTCSSSVQSFGTIVELPQLKRRVVGALQRSCPGGGDSDGWAKFYFYSPQPDSFPTSLSPWKTSFSCFSFSLPYPIFLGPNASRNMCRPLHGGTCSIRITAGRIISSCSICRHISVCVGGCRLRACELRACSQRATV